MVWKQENIWFTQSNKENKIPEKLLIYYWETKKAKKSMFFSSKNHKCVYFRLQSKIIKKTYLFRIK